MYHFQIAYEDEELDYDQACDTDSEDNDDQELAVYQKQVQAFH